MQGDGWLGERGWGRKGAQVGVEGTHMEGAPGSDLSCWGEKAGRPASHITKCLILSSQDKRQGLAFIFHQTCWIGSKMGLWMRPSQAHAPHPWYLNPGKKVTKERAQRRGDRAVRIQGRPQTPPVTSTLTVMFDPPIRATFSRVKSLSPTCPTPRLCPAHSAC